ncbi:hypothetical protein Acsp06_51040 [Actinomycetospora sp. NBRC 106375]|uniref:alkaline shock response membrane anchor protein AmaP n=1 Tax=Actinomycetospora sp. NBRC 106375 TaxID=3032207 RepID=UPI0024A06B32|nr:alkaline shock response membrane anchor protein AmaP [Actinomycetospora sp. NBRC 106375]GLZ48919.1 hypothetical protein Acsp06_51040 [Actinomycetospora sp. NBRC 106375]
MASPNRPARLNHTLLLLVAIVLLAAAAFALLLGSGVLAGLGMNSPGEASPLTPATLSPPTWVAYLAIVVAIVVGMLCLRWLIAQTIRKPATGTWRLESDPAGGVTRLDAQAAVDPFVDEVETYPGVHRATARLSGTSARPFLHLDIGTEDAADITALRRRIDTDAVPRLRRALDLPALPADLLVRLDAARSARLE